ncbi:MAG: uracil-DNA glycosylase [Acidobacteria bacterium]|nr:uracil-DNA glycosylase [Acidobacteriota bacterium]
MDATRQLAALNRLIIACRKCPRLTRYREQVAREKRRAYRDWDYWGRPVPGFGDPQAELLVLGLAPAAHGGNRTGRVFTGDRSGDFLFRALYAAGFANRPTSVSRDDGLRLRNCYITASVRCCPPQNKPTPEEQANCRPYLEEEFRLLQNVRAVLALGRIAHDTFLKLLKDQGRVKRLADFPFAHGAEHELLHPYFNRGIQLFDAFHPSQQNTQTGRLTRAMFNRVLRAVRNFIGTGGRI